MSNWIDELKSSIENELAGKAAVATLATVRLTAEGPQADARSIVVRQITGAGQLVITSDARSQKNRQLKQNPSAAVVFWFPKLRKQFRASGTARALSERDNNPMRLQAWKELSDSARALFHWPPAGQIRRENDKFVKAIPAESPMPESFEVLAVTVDSVETLDLNTHPHLRVKWFISNDVWVDQAINP